MTEEEKEEMELNIEAKYAGRTEKEFLNNITYAECLYILNTKNNYCDEIKDLSLLKLADIISIQQKETDKKDKVIDLMGYDLYHLDSLSYRCNIFNKEQLKQEYYKKVEEDNE